jgi:hypothetical protein
MIKICRLLHQASNLAYHILILIVIVLVIETPTLNVQFRDQKLEGEGRSRRLIVAVPCDNVNGRRAKTLG